MIKVPPLSLHLHVEATSWLTTVWLMLSGSMLQKLKLMLNLETIALRHKQSALAEKQQADAAEDVVTSAAASAASVGGVKMQAGPLITLRAAARNSSGRPFGVPQLQLDERALWAKRLDQVQILLVTVTQLHNMLLKICDKTEV